MNVWASSLLLASALALTACKPTIASAPRAPVADASPGRTSNKTAANADWSEPWPVLSTAFADLVPADAFIVMVNEGPLPPAAVEALEPLTRAALDAIDDGLRTRDTDGARRAIDFIGPSLDADDLRRLGLDPNPRVLLYSYGLATALRVSLADAGKIEALFRENPSPNVTLRNHHGQAFWDFPPGPVEEGEPPLQVVVAISGDDLLLGGFPPGFEDELLPLLFGQRLPEKRLWNTDFVGHAQREHGLMPHYLVRLNLQRLFALGTNTADGPDQAIANAMGLGSVAEECPDEFTRIFESTPVIYGGFRSFTKDSVESALVLEVAPALATALRVLASPIPGLEASPEPNESLALGVGFDFAGVEAIVSLWGRAVQERPFTCSEYVNFNELANGDELLSGVPTVLRHLKGAAVAVHSLGETERGAARVHAVIGFDDPLQALSGPFAAAFDIDPRKIPLRRVARVAEIAPFSALETDAPGTKITRTDAAVSIGTGTTPNATLRTAARVQRPNDGTLLLLRWNLVRWMDSPDRDFLSDDVPPSVNALVTAIFSYLQHGSMAVRARTSAVSLDVTLKR
ncbi:MAG: hypothetical protein AAGA54_19255 [Myxococcota bacterium]